jgi:hypothetical protein
MTLLPFRCHFRVYVVDTIIATIYLKFTAKSQSPWITLYYAQQLLQVVESSIVLEYRTVHMADSNLIVGCAVVFTVAAQCHGCGNEARLFDHSIAAKRRLFGLSLLMRRRLQSGCACTCAPDVNPRLAPSEEDSVMTFNDSIKALD